MEGQSSLVCEQKSNAAAAVSSRITLRLRDDATLSLERLAPIPSDLLLLTRPFSLLHAGVQPERSCISIQIFCTLCRHSEGACPSAICMHGISQYRDRQNDNCADEAGTQNGHVPLAVSTAGRPLPKIPNDAA